jgi:hypothetical protein
MPRCSVRSVIRRPHHAYDVPRACHARARSPRSVRGVLTSGTRCGRAGGASEERSAPERAEPELRDRRPIIQPDSRDSGCLHRLSLLGDRTAPWPRAIRRDRLRSRRGLIDWPLPPTSQAINAGDAASCPSTDRLGRPRSGSVIFRARTFSRSACRLCHRLLSVCTRAGAAPGGGG